MPTYTDESEIEWELLSGNVRDVMIMLLPANVADKRHGTVLRDGSA